jgi:regulator of cell morphogenesis and NO signaling
MSHVTNVFSPPGTALEDKTVGEIVAERPAQSKVFQSFGIDFCCQGGRTLRAACEKKGVAVEAVVEQLEAELRGKPAPEWNPADLPPAELVAYIVNTHHRYQKDEMPRLMAMAARVAQVHGGHTPSLVEVFEIYKHMAEDMDSHMMKEEQVLFPAITRLAAGEAAAMPLDGPIAMMLHEHEDAGAELEKLRELTDGFVPPPTACNTYRALFAGLAEMETDLHRHIHLENAVLFPSALALAEKQG